MNLHGWRGDDVRIMPSDKALRDFAYRALIGEIDELRPGTTPTEVRFFVEQMSPYDLQKLYHLMHFTGLVE